MVHQTAPLFLILLTILAVVGIAAGCVLAITGYSSAGPFAVASACVGVLGTLATENRMEHREGSLSWQARHQEPVGPEASSTPDPSPGPNER